MGKGAQIAIASLTVFAALAWFVSMQAGGEGTFRYYASVSDYLANPDPTSSSARGSRVHGFVQEGSIDKNFPQGYVDFVIHDDGEGRLAVRYDGIDVPDLFKDGAEVVVEGRHTGDRFVADRVMAKCPSKYEAKEEPGSEA
jgi:cytochrome c-type biogenesis protein CcmE